MYGVLWYSMYVCYGMLWYSMICYVNMVVGFLLYGSNGTVSTHSDFVVGRKQTNKKKTKEKKRKMNAIIYFSRIN